ncbi:hypothetical protein F5148DRAFT_753623 [Russula earlei]|uniref:Uncharacterized protein n=1 Tax=Russula earlei TaxID=71964 RepID=A0ACC0UEB3_9AGAM|nr:hypothetical protein F5148DRAFT_753623 [Russula earlei]
MTAELSRRELPSREMREGLESKSGVSKLLHAREYRRAARDAYRYAKGASERGRDAAVFFHQPDTSSAAPEDTYDHVMRVARSLYRCYLTCKDAFPSLHVKEEWAAAVWSESCSRTGMSPNQLPYPEELIYGNMSHIADLKTKIMHQVESLYGFDTSQAPDSIGRNSRVAQALLTKMAFIYREPNLGGTPCHPYRHPIIQKVINITWFQNKDSGGIVFHDHFTPMPIQSIALALTVIESCIDEWTDGTRRESSWDESRYKTVYFSHVSSLNVLRDHDQPQGSDFLAHIQDSLLKDARVHAGAPPEPVTVLPRLLPQNVDAALDDDLPAYYDPDNQIPMIVVDET